MTDLCGISQEAFDLIVEEETGGRTLYEKTECHPTYPGGASGVTIGIGYDCGYSTAQQIAADWGPYVDAKTLQALQDVAGIHGPPAASHASELHWITIPWDTAIQVFTLRDIPKWTGITRHALPNYDKLPPDCCGALTSLSFNRGASYSTSGDRYTEMRNIKWHMTTMEYDKIPAEIRSMKRLWQGQGLDGLLSRRDHEAALFEKGLGELDGDPDTTPASTV